MVNFDLIGYEISQITLFFTLLIILNLFQQISNVLILSYSKKLRP